MKVYVCSRAVSGNMKAMVTMTSMSMIDIASGSVKRRILGVLYPDARKSKIDKGFKFVTCTSQVSVVDYFGDNDISSDAMKRNQNDDAYLFFSPVHSISE